MIIIVWFEEWTRFAISWVPILKVIFLAFYKTIKLNFVSFLNSNEYPLKAERHIGSYAFTKLLNIQFDLYSRKECLHRTCIMWNVVSSVYIYTWNGNISGVNKDNKVVDSIKVVFCRIFLFSRGYIIMFLRLCEYYISIQQNYSMKF